MSVGSRRAEHWRARSRACIALVVLTAWFGTLLVAAPLTTASAAPATTITIVGPTVSPDNDATPTWIFTLPPEDPGTASSPQPVLDINGAPTSDTSTATIALTHRGECAIGAAPPYIPPSYAPCTTSTGQANEYAFTAPTLSANGDYWFYVHDVEYATTTTTTYHADGTTSDSVSGPIPTGTGPDSSAGPYTYDGTPPTLTLDTFPTSPGTSTAPQWTFTAADAGAAPALVQCSLTPQGSLPVWTACTTAGSYTGSVTTNGVYDFVVAAEDTLGNRVTRTSSYELVSAGAPSVSVAAGSGINTTTTPTTGRATTIDWTIVPVAGASSTHAVLTGPGPSPASVDYPGLAGNATTLQTPLPGATNGLWTLTVTAVVSGRDSATGSATYLLDTVQPVLSVSTVDATNPATPSWTVTADETSAVPQCRLTGTTSTGSSVDTGTAACGATYTAPTLAQGNYTLTVSAVDAAGNPATAVTRTYVYDLPPATPVITGPLTGNGPTVTWTVTTESTATLTCTVTGPGFTASSPADFTCANGNQVAVTVTLPSGPGVNRDYTLTVTANDGGGSTSATSTPYTLDRTPPATPTFGAGSSGSQSFPAVSWAFSATEGTITCQLVQKTSPTTESATVASCPTSPYATDLPSPGEWWLRVTATDAAGNTSSADSAHVLYDISNPDAPGVTLTSSTPTNDPATTWSLTTTEPVGSGYTFLCTWSGPGIVTPTETTCTPTSPSTAYSYTLPAANGTYTLSVVVRDAALNLSTPTTGTVLFDDKAPVVTFTSVPTTPRKDPSVSWTTTVNEPSVKTECQLTVRTTGADNVLEPWSTVNCGRTVTRTLPGEGTYFLQVRDTDAAGNVTLTGTQSVDVVLDTTAPGAPTVTGSNGFSQDPNASWTITPASGPTDPTTTYLCRLVKDNVTTGTTWVSCDSDPTTTAVVFVIVLPADGTYRLDVQATDPAGNLSLPIVSSLPYTLDRQPPPAPGVSTTTYVSNNATPIWTLTGEDSAARFTCTWTTTISPVPAGMPANGACTSPYSATLPADGTYRLTVTQTDRAGNTSLTGTYQDYLLDTVKPAAPSNVVGPTGTASTLSGSYTFTADAGTVSCRLLFSPVGSASAPAPTSASPFTTCTSPWPVTYSQGDGSYQLQLHVTDAAGNVGPDALSAVYTLDTQGPLAPTFVTQPTGTKNVKTVTWTWTGETPSTGTCTLSFTAIGSSTPVDVAGPVACDGFSYTTTLSAGDGTYQLTVQLADPSKNAGATAGSALYVLDATAPGAPTVSGPGATSNATSADYAITSTVEALATAECLLFKDKVQIGDWAACTMPRTINLPGDGSYVLQVRLTDQYGNVGAIGESPAYLLDTKAPTAPVVTAPSSPSSNAAPSFSIVTDVDTKTTCKLTRGSVVATDTVACTGSFTASLSGMPDGDYVLSVIATDPAGNTASGISAAYTYDTTKPLAPVVSGPAGPSQTRTPVFSWSGEAGTTAECSLQEKLGATVGWTACASPYAPSLPSDGTWVLSVRLTDAAKNLGDPGASGAYVFDTTPPPTPVVTPPTSPGRDLNPSWSAATEEGSKTECRLTGPGQLGTWGPCTLPLDTPVTSDGTYTFDVRATDVAGNVSPVGSGSYVLDTMAPGAPVVAAPVSPGRSRAPAISFTTEAGSTGSCKLTRGATVLSDSAACSSPVTLDLTGLPDGAYTLSVRAVDAAGNVGPAASATYALDTTAPSAPTMTLVAGSPSSDRAPAFAFSSESGTTASCKVTSPGGTVKDLACTGGTVTLDLSGATDGTYTLAIHVTDPAGNASPAATVSYVLDSNAPAAPKLVGPPTPGNNRAPVWKVSSASPAECRLTRGTTVVKDWTPCATSYAADLYSQPDGAYVLEARVIGTTAPSSSRYRLDTTAPAAATIVGPPSPSTDRRPTWAVSSSDTTATAQCRVLVFTGVLTDWAPCGVSSAGSLFSYDLTTAGDGTYTLAVRLTDAAGNLGPVATSDYVLDTSAPSAVGVIAPASPGSDTTPTWALTSATGVKLECRVTSGQKVITDFAPCAGTFTADLTGLPDGTYTLTVHALSAAGTPGPETTSGYILDTTAAGTPGALAGPTGPSRDRAPRWTFTLPAGTTGLCKVTLGTKVVSEGPCTSPYTLDLSNAADGTYTLTVRAIDPAGNVSSPSTAGYVLKTTAPPAPSYTTLPGSPSSTTDPKWGFSLSRGTTAQCRLLQAGNALEDWTACTSPVTAFLSGKPDGSYTMQVRAIDLAGNTSSPASGGGDYTFDRTAAPLAQFADTPITPGNDTSPTWVIAQPATVTTTPAPALLRTAALTGTPQTECRLTTAARLVGSWTPCSGSYTATTNGDGSYLLEVRAFDATGERGPVTSSAYLLDTRAPAAPRFTDPIPPTVGNDSEVAWSWADEGNLVECHVVRNGAPLSAFAECSAPHVFSIGRLGEATYSIEVRAVDAAGNVGAVATASYRYDTTPPPAPVFSAQPPSRGTSSSVGWTYPVPVDAHAICVVSRNGTVVSEGACTNSFTLDLRGQQPATWTLSVHLVDSAGNVGAATTGSYMLTTALASIGRVASPGGPGNTDNGGFVPSRPGRDGTSGPAGPPAAVPAADTPILSGPGADPRPGSSVRTVVPDAIKKGAREVARAVASIPGALPGTNVPAAIKNVLNQTITKPQLPLVLLVIVLLFLLVQNRIDRRDPKLAIAPANAEPELTFGPILRPGGATA